MNVLLFQVKEPIRSYKIVNDLIIKQVSHFNYLWNDVSYDKNNDINVKLKATL